MLSRFTLEQIVQDVRFACRLLAKERAYSAAAVAALALGIGANAAGFTIINATLLRGLPYEASDRLYVISWQNRAGRRVNASRADLDAWRAASSFSELAAYRDASVNISGVRSIPEQVTGTWVTANAFTVLRRRPILGRDLESTDERPGTNPVLLISHDVWQRHYGSDPNAIGTLLRVNGTPATIVGVMPEGMRFPDNSDVWMPLPASNTEAGRRVLRVFGRLSDSADRARADTEMRLLASQAIAASPDASRDLIGVRVETFADRYVGGMGRAMFLTVMGAVILVLLIACGNVANLLLVRTTARTREMAMRVAVGATRARIVRQLLVESLVLSAIGGVAGLALATAGVRIFGIAMQGSGLPYWVVFDVDRVVFAYVAALCVAVAVLFGLAPAWHVSKAGPHDVLKESGRGSAGVRARRFGSAMVVMELALTTTVLVGAGLLIRSFLVLHSIDLGFSTDGLLTMRVQLPAAKYETPEARLAFFERLEPQLAAIPGVEAAAVTNGVPPNDGGERLLEVDRPGAASVEPVFVGTVAITPRFFDVLGVSLVRGRNFDSHDGAPGTDTVIVNQRLAAQFFPTEDPIGRRIRFTQRDAAPGRALDRWRTIVGIAPQVKHGSPQDGYDNAVVYLPYRQEADAAVSLLMRSSRPPETVIAAVRREVQAIDADQPVLSIQTLSQSLAESQWWWRTWGSVFGVFSCIALVLSGVGLYAVIAYSVAQRRQEIGIRMALGAQRLAVCSMILKRAIAQLIVGLSLGLTGAFFLSALLWGRGMIVIPPDDRITYASVSILLSVVALAASLLPAYRAAHIDPMVVLRAE